jgi:hypothetical protein
LQSKTVLCVPESVVGGAESRFGIVTLTGAAQKVRPPLTAGEQGAAAVSVGDTS